MSLRKSPELSAPFLSANQLNAQKSTGPRTPAGKRRVSQNSLRHGLYATPDVQLRQHMEQLDEDPEQLARLEEELAKSCAPDDAMQALIVSDLARLYWKKSQLAKCLVDIRIDERRIDEKRFALFKMQADDETDTIDECELSARGYRQIETNQTVFIECDRLVSQLWARVKAKDLGGDLSEVFTSLYDASPNRRGKRIISLFDQLAPSKGVPAPSLDGPAYLELLQLVAVEKACVALEYTYYRESKKEAFRETTGSEWLPSSDNWGKAIAQDAKLSLQIDRQTRLLMRLKRQTRRDNREAKFVQKANKDGTKP